MQDKNLTKIAEIPQIAKIVKITDYCLKLENTGITKNTEDWKNIKITENCLNNVIFLTCRSCGNVSL